MGNGLVSASNVFELERLSHLKVLPFFGFDDIPTPSNDLAIFAPARDNLNSNPQRHR
jgi:hypothetical protein